METVSNEPEWVEIDCFGETTGQQYVGRFYVKPFAGIKEQAAAIREGEFLARGIEYDQEMRLLLQNCAAVSQFVVEHDTKWWAKDKWGDLLDEAPINAIASKIAQLRAKRSIKRQAPVTGAVAKAAQPAEAPKA